MRFISIAVIMYASYPLSFYLYVFTTLRREVDKERREEKNEKAQLTDVRMANHLSSLQKHWENSAPYPEATETGCVDRDGNANIPALSQLEQPANGARSLSQDRSS